MRGAIGQGRGRVPSPGNRHPGPFGIFGDSSTIDVLVDGVLVGSRTNNETSGGVNRVWHQFTVSFTATNATTTIRFGNADVDTSNALDRSPGRQPCRRSSAGAEVLPVDKETPESLYRTRRRFLQDLGLATGAAAVAVGLGGSRRAPDESGPKDELGASATPYDMVAGYNNFHEYEMSKQHELVKTRVGRFRPLPWTLTVGGLVRRPLTLAYEDVLRRFPSEERIYRMRCVEAWSMVIPWLGFPLSQLLARAEPLGSARFVRFDSVMRPAEMPLQNDPGFPWPYTEGLRIDEAMNPLTIMATGLYGRPLPTQNGAPLRLVVPWKYGYKSVKCVTNIELVEQMPATFWTTMNPVFYGFYANVNPNVQHPVWSQRSERRIGEYGRRPTLMFNGYQEQVAHLYQGMDLRQNY